MKSKIKVFLIFFIFLLALFNIAGVSIAHADLVGCGDHLPANATPQEIKDNECNLHDLVLVVLRLINLLVSFAGFVCMIWIVWAGWQLVTSGGNEEAITKGKDTLRHAIIGFFLVVVAYILLEAITIILGGPGFTLSNLYNFLK